jgi:hypothetical protein
MFAHKVLQEFMAYVKNTKNMFQEIVLLKHSKLFFYTRHKKYSFLPKLYVRL